MSDPADTGREESGAARDSLDRDALRSAIGHWYLHRDLAPLRAIFPQAAAWKDGCRSLLEALGQILAVEPSLDPIEAGDRLEKARQRAERVLLDELIEEALGATAAGGVLEPYEAPAEELPSQAGIEAARETVAAAIARAEAGDPGAPFAEAVLAALRSLREAVLSEYETAIGKLRAAKVRISKLEGAMGGDGRDAGDAEEEKVTEALLRIADDAELWRTPDRTAYATVPVGDHSETWPVRSKGFRMWLTREFFEERGTAPNGEAMAAVLNTLEARAQFDGAEHPVYVRVAPRTQGGYFLDLVDTEWRAVELMASGWKVIELPPVRFRRKGGMLALPEPVAGGGVDELRRFLNLGHDEDAWRLILAWLTHAMTVRGPFCVLALHGEQGSAKSTAARVFRRIIDPHKVELRSEPRDERDLMIAAEGSWIIVLDNLSSLSREGSDVLCRLATGGGFATRALYTDDEEKLFESTRPVILTGIEELATASDLLDRSLIITLAALDEDERLEEEEFWSAFEEGRPRILGALLDVVARALRALPASRPRRLFRMGDFHRWGAAVERALGWPKGSFTDAYGRNRAEAVGITLEASPVGRVFLAWCRSRGAWSGTAATLLAELEAIVDDKTRKVRSWPNTPKGLSGILRRLAPALRSTGIRVDFFREQGGHRERTIQITRSDEAVENASRASQPSPKGEGGRDDRDGWDANSLAPSGDTSSGTVRREPGEEEATPDPSRNTGPGKEVWG